MKKTRITQIYGSLEGKEVIKIVEEIRSEKDKKEKEIDNEDRTDDETDEVSSAMKKLKETWKSLSPPINGTFGHQNDQLHCLLANLSENFL